MKKDARHLQIDLNSKGQGKTLKKEKEKEK